MSPLIIVLVAAVSILKRQPCEATGCEKTIHLYDATVNSTKCASPAFDINSVALNISSHIEIYFCQKNLTLTKKWNMSGVAHVKINGPVTLKCSKRVSILFENVTNLTICEAKLINCGGQRFNLTTRAGVFIFNTSNISISEVVILNSFGAGLYIKNASGEVQIANSSFNHTQKRSNSKFYIGVHLELESENATYKLLNCSFASKNRTQGNCSGCHFQEVYQGGGLRILLGANVARNTIIIQDCVFRNLSAVHIGGIDIAIGGNATGNLILISNTTFVNNTCNKCGGGAIRIRMTEVPAGNNMTITNSSFTGNLARFGGGIFLNISMELVQSMKNSLNIYNCNWTRNGGRYGSAVDAISSLKDSSLVMEVTFKNNRFTDNFIRAFVSHSTTVYGQGTVSLKHISAKFEGRTAFIENVGSPLLLRSSLVEFGIKSNVNFFNNKGLNGGAITLLESSVISARSRSVLNFTQNEAYFKGGAIFHRIIDGHDYLTNRKCFIQFPDSNKKNRPPKYIFTNNTAGSQFNKNDSLGKSVFASTLLPCNRQCGHYKGSSTYKASEKESFDCVGEFVYNDTRAFEVATSAWTIKLDENVLPPLPVIPGKEIKLPIKTRDELGHILPTVYRAILWKDYSTNTTARVDTPYRYTHANATVILGEPSDAILNLSLNTEHDREMRILVAIKIAECPPGYILKQEKCRCSAELGVNKRYRGITSCDSDNFQAILTRGYWIGYQESNNYTSLISSICPYGFCDDIKKENEYKLPGTFSATELDLLVCGESRTGRLCGQCRHNMSVYYHSSTYRCGSNRLCSIGWLLYGLSELLPVTLIFLIIIAFDIQLTAGTLNGLILYYQLSNSMMILVNNFPELAKYLYRGHAFLSNMFDLNTFFEEKFSFCLWRGAMALHIIAFKYVTVAYSLVLVILTVYVMTTCGHRLSCSKVRKLKQQKRQVTNSVIHGLSGFFILCYSQCATASLRLLRSVNYFGPNDSVVRDIRERHVLYDGSMRYFKGPHLYYAIPALFFISTLVTVPPILLLAYPLCYRVLRLLRIEETKFSTILCKLVPLEKLKPFFDSFQGSFKDEHRYTSGLYFVYRLILVILAVFTTPNSNLFYILLEIQLLVMIFIHAYFQPYKKTKHNRQDLFLFVNLAVVNALTLYNFQLISHVSNRYIVYILTCIQTLLLNLPTLYVVLKISFFLFVLTRAHYARMQVSAAVDVELLTEREETGDHNNFESSNTYAVLEKEAETL